MRSHWRALRTALLALALLSFFSGIGLHTYFGLTRPTTANPETGRVHALNHHGKWVYLTSSEMYLFEGAFAVFVGGILGALAIQVLAGRDNDLNHPLT